MRAYTQEWALYVAGLIHQDRYAVIKVVKYGLDIQSYSDAYVVELVERVIAKQRDHPDEPKPPLGAE